MDNDQSLRFRLAISEDMFLHYYRGQVQDVMVRATNGASVRFPAKLLRQFVTSSGIHGLFELTYDADNRFRAIHRLG